MNIVARFFPNGEFTQGVDTSSKRRDKRRNTPTQPLTQECRDGYLQWAGMQISNGDADINLCVPGYQFRGKTGGIFTYLCQEGEQHHLAFECDEYVLDDVVLDKPIGQLVGSGDLIPLGLSDARMLNRPAQSRKRLEAMTKNMGRNLRNAAFMLEQKYSKDLLSFLTLTVPKLSEPDMCKVCEQWDRLVHQFLMWLRRRLQKKYIQFEYVYCTEIQPKRLEIYGEAVPHLHLVFRGRYAKKSAWAVAPAMVRKAWVQCLKSVLGHCEFEQRALENIQRVRKSVSRYLSKYLSKRTNNSSNKAPVSVAKSTIRTQWGGMSRNLSRAVKLATTVLRGNGEEGCIVATMFQKIPQLITLGLVRYYKSGFIQLGKHPDDTNPNGLKVGTGALSTPTLYGGLADCLAVIDTGGALDSSLGRRLIRNIAELLTTLVSTSDNQGVVY